ncbi:MAG: DUF2946 family protein [Pseudolabrys sp.]|nr:DUF2946 family protein [Pseudolabrys sp.]
MHWIRTQQERIGLVALFAIALQLALAFGHTHAGDFAPTHDANAVAHSSTGHSPAVTGPADSGGQDDDQDRNHDRDHDRGAGHGGCAICVTTHTAQALLLPAPPQIAKIAEQPARWLFVSHVFDLADTAQQPFQARAPPRS